MVCKNRKHVFVVYIDLFEKQRLSTICGCGHQDNGCSATICVDKSGDRTKKVRYVRLRYLVLVTLKENCAASTFSPLVWISCVP